MSPRRHLFLLLAIAATAWALPATAQHQHGVSSENSEPHAIALLQAAVHSELAAAETDHSVWTYRDHDKTADKDALYDVVDSPQGGVRRAIQFDGHPVGPDTRAAETQRITDFVRDPAAQAKQHRAGQHDDAQARQMLLMLPNAFIWTVKGDSGDLTTLTFRPNPTFHPPNMEARVMGLMAGELIIARADNRIRTLRGSLTDDIKIGFGMLGKLRAGGTFDVERREIAPHIWQITETHVHIDGKALLFKTIGQQEDEIKSDWKPSTAKTLQEAARQLDAG